MNRSGLHRAAADERGATLFIVAVAMFGLLMLSAFVVDVANFYVHKRHLQLQADAAALAGAQSYVVGNCSDAGVVASTRSYGGSASDGTTVLTEPYNNQLGGTSSSNMYLLTNSAGYWGDTGTYGNNTDPNGSPCSAKYIDVKLTETNLPWFFGFGGIVRRINAHARVGLVQVGQTNGTLPIAVPNPLPSSAAAIFVDETTTPLTVVKAVKLSHVGVSNQLDMWSNGSNPVTVTIPSRATGVVIALSGKSPADLAIANNMTLTAMCDQTLTDCYDGGSDPPTNGLSFIRGYSGVGSGTQPNPPILRSVELFPGNCPNIAYFSANTSTCNFELVARIDAGTALPKADQIYTANGVALTSGTDPNCAFVAGSDQCWHGNLSLPASSGPDRINMTWEETSGQVQIGAKLETCKTGGGNKCTGSFEGGAAVQRAYSATNPTNGGPTSGPIQLVDLCNTGTDPSCTSSDSQSYLVGDQKTFVVTIGIGGTLQNATSTTDPLVSLRLRSAQSNQALDCDPGYTNLKTELAKGCRPNYTINAGTPDCATLGTSALWATAQPWSCIAVQQGVAQNDVAAGLNTRIFGDPNPPNTAPQCASGLGSLGYNNWAMFNQSYQPTGVADPTYGVIRGQDGFPPGDPRVLDAFLTTYGAFSHVNGTSGSVPIIGFGHFYVTGYTSNGGGFSPPTNCNQQGVPNNDPGVVVGHFIRYTDFSGGTGTTPCDPNSINACTIVMTK